MKTTQIVFIIILALIIGFMGWQIYLPKNAFSKEKTIFDFYIERGEGSREIALNLEKEGLITWAPIFRVYVATMGVSGKLQAGKYQLSPSMNMPEMVEKFVKGDVAKIKITIPEGFTVKQIEEKLNIKIDPNLEGFLFPDTYQFLYDATSGEIVQTMRDNFEKKLTPDLKEEIERQNKTIFEIITTASLIEKEVNTQEDKELVSGILWKRLKIGMPLQVDSEKWTYENRGLPPVPICNPGLESIKTAVYPKNSDYWYYLSSQDGETHFSKTLEEHNIKKAKYLK